MGRLANSKVFQESIAGRQPDFRHGRPLDIQLTLTGHWLGSWARGVERPNPSQPNAPPCTTAVFVLSARSSYSPARRGGLLPLVFLSFFPESLFIAENCFPTAKTVPSKAVDNARLSGTIVTYRIWIIVNHRSYVVIIHTSWVIYREGLVVADLGWVVMDLGHSTACPVLLGLMAVWQNWLGSWAR